MAQFPALPIFTDALLADCGHLDDAEFGRYLKILILMWRTPRCRIPDDHNWICKRLRVDALAYQVDVHPILQEFCTCDAGFWTQKRLLKEYEYVQDLSEKRKRAAAARWANASVPEKPNKKLMHMDQPRTSKSDAPTPTPTPQGVIKIQTPPTVSAGEGGFQKIGGRVLEKVLVKADPTTYDILRLIGGKDIEKAKFAAPGWSIDYLAGVYNRGIHSGKRLPPERPELAFLAWIPRYTKDKPPK